MSAEQTSFIFQGISIAAEFLSIYVSIVSVSLFSPFFSVTAMGVGKLRHKCQHLKTRQILSELV